MIGESLMNVLVQRITKVLTEPSSRYFEESLTQPLCKQNCAGTQQLVFCSTWNSLCIGCHSLNSPHINIERCENQIFRSLLPCEITKTPNYKWHEGGWWQPLRTTSCKTARNKKQQSLFQDLQESSLGSAVSTSDYAALFIQKVIKTSQAPKPFESTTGKVIEAAGRLLLVGQEQQRWLKLWATHINVK